MKRKHHFPIDEYEVAKEKYCKAVASCRRMIVSEQMMIRQRNSLYDNAIHNNFMTPEAEMLYRDIIQANLLIITRMCDKHYKNIELPIRRIFTFPSPEQSWLPCDIISLILSYTSKIDNRRMSQVSKFFYSYIMDNCDIAGYLLFLDNK